MKYTKNTKPKLTPKNEIWT